MKMSRLINLDHAKEKEIIGESDIKDFFHLSPDLFCVMQADGKIEKANPAWLKILGWNPSELISQFWIDLIHLEDVAQTQAALTLTTGEENTASVETRLRQQDGCYKWFAWSLSRSQTGLIYAVGKDVTHYRQKEDHLKNERQALYNLLDQLPAFLYLQPKDYSVGFYNQRFREIFGDPEGRRCYETIAGLKQPCPQCPTFHVFDTKTPQIWEWNDPRNGRFYQIYDYPFIGSNGEMMVVEMGLDITLLKQAEAARKQTEAQLREKNQQLQASLQELQRAQSQLIHSEKMSSLGQLVAGIAHEINNPVNFIYGNINYAITYFYELLALVLAYQKTYPEPEAEIKDQIEKIELDFLKEDLLSLLSSIQAGANRIKDIVLSLRNFSRLDEAGMKAVDLHTGINSTLMILAHRLQNQPNRPGIKIIKNFGDLPLLECYASDINQVFLNIFTNAIDALEEKWQEHKDWVPTIKIETALSKGKALNKNNANQIKKDLIIIHITDNGIGLKSDLESHLFEPFFTTKPIGKNRGLGLFICHQIIVETHQGKLEYKSQFGEGTEFLIKLPSS